MPLPDAVLDRLPVRVYFKDLDGRFVRVNPAAAAALGLADPAAAAGTTDADYFGPVHAARTRADEDRVTRTGTAIVGQREREDWPDGRVTWVDTSKFPWLADDGVTVCGVVGVSVDVTAEVRAVERAERAERLLDATPALVFVKDRRLRFTYVNQTLARVLGRDRDDILGRTDAEVIRDPGQVRGFRADDEAVLGGDGTEAVTRELLTDAGGTELRLETRKVRYHPDPDGDAEILGVAVNITDEWNAREAARRETELLDALMNNVPDGIFFKSPDGRFTRVNKALAALVGKASPHEVVGRTDGDLFDARFAAESAAEEREMLRTHAPLHEIVRRAVLPGRGVVWRLVSKVPIVSGGKVVQIVGVSKDITRLKTEQLWLQLGLDEIPHPVFVKDRDLRYRLVNRALLDRHGLADARELLGKTDFERGLPAGEAEAYRASDVRVMATGEPFTSEGPQLLRTGERRVIRTLKLPIREEEAGPAAGVLGILQDVTQEREHDRIEFHARIARSVRHCLKNWLSLAVGHMDVLARRVPGLTETGPWQNLARTVRRLKRAADLATNLAATDRLAAAALTPVLVSDLVRQVVEDHNDGRVRLGELPPDVVCPAAEFHLENAVMELLANARDFVPADTGRIDVWVETGGGTARIHVADNGPGVPPAMRGEHLFTGTFPPNPRRTGMGLLYIGEVVRHHPGARVREVGDHRGAHFVIELPVAGGGGPA